MSEFKAAFEILGESLSKLTPEKQDKYDEMMETIFYAVAEKHGIDPRKLVEAYQDIQTNGARYIAREILKDPTLSEQTRAMWESVLIK